MAKSIFPAASSLGVSDLGVRKLCTSISGADKVIFLISSGRSLYSEVSPIEILKVALAVLGSKVSD